MRPLLRKQPLFLLLLLARLDGLGNAIGLTGVDGLACLLDLLEDGAVVEAVVGLDCSGLGFEGDVELLDTCEGQSVSSTRILRGAYTCTGRTDSPSSFLSTRSTAPEQPPQVMVMLNL